MKTSLSNNNFNVGVVNQAVNGRYDLNIYQNGLNICNNFIISYEGGLKNRTGLLKLLDTEESIIIPFVFNRSQSYIVQFTKLGKIKFLTYSTSGRFGYVYNDGSLFELDSPYTWEQVQEIKFAQKEDVMYIVQHDVAPQKLTRTSATTFTIAPEVFKPATTFTAPNYPSSVAFYENRIFYGGIKNKPTYLYASDVGHYETFTFTGTEDDLDGFNFDLSNTSQNIDWIFPTINTLMCGCNDGIISCNGSGSAMTKKNFFSKKASDNGANKTTPIKINNYVIYIDETNNNTRSFTYDLVSENFTTPNLNLINNDFTQQGFKDIKTVKNKNNYTYLLLNDGNMMFLNYLPEESVNTWTSFSFADGVTVEGIQNIYRGYDSFEDLICLVKFDNKYYFCKLADEVQLKSRDMFYSDNQQEDEQIYQRYISEAAKQFNYLDLSKTFKNEYNSTITYNKDTNILTSTETDFTSADVNKNIIYKTIDGKDYGTFKILSFIDSQNVEVENIRYNGYSTNTYSSWYKTFNKLTISDPMYYNKIVSVIGDGGYIGDYQVDSEGNIDLERQLTVAIIGFKYTSIAKSLNLGFSINGITTQITRKNIIKINLRCNNSAGGKFGTSMYELEPIQNFNPSGYYDNIPLLMNNDVEINVFDRWDKEKSWYIVQDEPLPLNITMLTITRDDNEN